MRNEQKTPHSVTSAIASAAAPFAMTAFVSLWVFMPNFRVPNTAHTPDKLSAIFIALLFSTFFISKLVFRILAAYAVLLNSIYLHVSHHWGAGEPGRRLSLIFESPWHEQYEYIRSYLTAYDLLIAAYVAVAAFALRKLPARKISRKASFAFLVLTCLLASLLLASQRLFSLPLINTPFQVSADWHAKKMATVRNSVIQASRDRAQPANCSENYRNVVVVVGESANRDHMSLYGYPRSTTPFAESLSPYVFKTISPANQTRYSVPIMLTGVTAERYQDFFHTESVVSRLKDCGYKTYWISNQGLSGEHDSSVTSIGREADVFFLPNIHSWISGYDEDLLQALPSADASERVAVFIHLMGSHFSYEKRVPPTFLEERPRDSKSHSYDLTIEYTDYVLKNIFSRFPKDSLLFVYASDHGELVGEDQAGHGFSPSYQDEYRNAFFAWSSKPSRLQAFQGAVAGRMFNLESFGGILDYLVGRVSDMPPVSESMKVIEASDTHIVDYRALKPYGSTRSMTGAE